MKHVCVQAIFFIQGGKHPSMWPCEKPEASSPGLLPHQNPYCILLGLQQHHLLLFLLLLLNSREKVYMILFCCDQGRNNIPHFLPLDKLCALHIARNMTRKVERDNSNPSQISQCEIYMHMYVYASESRSLLCGQNDRSKRVSVSGKNHSFSNQEFFKVPALKQKHCAVKGIVYCLLL